MPPIRDIGANTASATSTDEVPPEDSQSPFSSSTDSCSIIPLLFAKDCNVGVAESILSNFFEDVICERDTLSYTMNDIKVPFQKA